MKKIYWTKIWIKYDFYFLRLLLLKPWPWDYSDDFLFTFVSSWFFSNSFLFFISSLSALFLSNSFFLSSFSYLSFSWSTQICLHSSDWGSNLAEPSGFLTFLSVVLFGRLHGTLAWRTPLTTWRSVATSTSTSHTISTVSSFSVSILWGSQDNHKASEHSWRNPLC